MSVSEKLEKIANNEVLVYNSAYTKGIFDAGYTEGVEDGKNEGYETGFAEGKEAGYDDGVEAQKAVSVDWDVIQDYGDRKYYSHAFAYWGATEINPKYMIAPSTTGFINAFQGATKLQEVVWDNFDLSEVTSFYQCFNSCFELKSIDIDLVPASLVTNCWQYVFSGCNVLKKIQKIKAMIGHTWTGSFNKCYELTDITFADDGVIGNDISFADCEKLSEKSIASIINHLSWEVSGKTLTLNKTAVNTACNFDIDDPSTYDYSSNTFLVCAGQLTNWTFMIGDTEITFGN